MNAFLILRTTLKRQITEIVSYENTLVRSPVPEISSTGSDFIFQTGWCLYCPCCNKKVLEEYPSLWNDVFTRKINIGKALTSPNLVTGNWDKVLLKKLTSRASHSPRSQMCLHVTGSISEKTRPCMTCTVQSPKIFLRTKTSFRMSKRIWVLLKLHQSGKTAALLPYTTLNPVLQLYYKSVLFPCKLTVPPLFTVKFRL